VKVSVPVRPSDCRVWPSNSAGSTPMPIRLERWMRSKLLAMTAFTPSSIVPLAAQSRELPVPYSSPARTTSGVPLRRSAWPRRRSLICSPLGWCSREPPSTPGSMRFFRRMLAKVPRTMTSWLPRRAPYWL
jgi:hypothetical protein